MKVKMISRLQKVLQQANRTKPQYIYPVGIYAGSLVLIVQLWFCTISSLLQDCCNHIQS